MEHTFEKESLRIEWVPIAILLVLSLVFAVSFIVSIVTSGSVVLTVGSLVMAVVFAAPPILGYGYLQSFRRVKVSGNTITVIRRKDTPAFEIPDHLGRVKIDPEDLQLELKRDGQRFVLRSHFLRNKASFHALFDQMIKDRPPSKDKVILKASVLEIMDNLKKG